MENINNNELSVSGNFLGYNIENYYLSNNDFIVTPILYQGLLTIKDPIYSYENGGFFKKTKYYISFIHNQKLIKVPISKNHFLYRQLPKVFLYLYSNDKYTWYLEPKLINFVLHQKT